MAIYHIRKGYNLPISGLAEKIFASSSPSTHFSVRPTDFHYIKPKLKVKVGDSVEIGTPLFFDKLQPEVNFCSPASGKIKSIDYGERKSIQRINLISSGENYKQWPNYKVDKISSIPREELISLLCESGLWPLLRQRPFDIIARINQEIDAIFVNAMDTSPLAMDQEFALAEDLIDFKAGISALKVLCKTIHIISQKKEAKSIFHGIKGVADHSFYGPHPAGLVSTHIQKILPLNAKKSIWYINAKDVIRIGKFLLVGQWPTYNTIALVGSAIKERVYYKFKHGMSLEKLLENRLVDENSRIISGNILTGTSIQKTDSLGFYDNLVTVIPEGEDRHFLGWMGFGFTRYTWSKTFLSKLLPKKAYNMNTNLNGELRAFVKTGDYEKVTPIDVLPSFLAKAILAEDIELMEKLGIYEVAPEDFALCSYICPSKIEFSHIIRKGLNMMLAETV